LKKKSLNFGQFINNLPLEVIHAAKIALYKYSSLRQLVTKSPTNSTIAYTFDGYLTRSSFRNSYLILFSIANRHRYNISSDIFLQLSTYLSSQIKGKMQAIFWGYPDSVSTQYFYLHDLITAAFSNSTSDLLTSDLVREYMQSAAESSENGSTFTNEPIILPKSKPYNLYFASTVCNPIQTYNKICNSDAPLIVIVNTHNGFWPDTVSLRFRASSISSVTFNSSPRYDHNSDFLKSLTTLPHYFMKFYQEIDNDSSNSDLSEILCNKLIKLCLRISHLYHSYWLSPSLVSGLSCLLSNASCLIMPNNLLPEHHLLLFPSTIALDCPKPLDLHTVPHNKMPHIHPKLFDSLIRKNIPIKSITHHFSSAIIT
jgi:hypothetical protein